jgi:hypothetical protein
MAHAAGADTDEHLDEVRTGDREERHLGLAGDGAREQGLAGARRPHHQHAARNLAAELLEARGVAQEVDQLADVFLGLVATGDVGEGDLDLVLALHLRARFAEAQCAAAAAAALHLSHEEEQQADEQDEREPVQQDIHESGAGLRRVAGNLDLAVAAQQVVHQLLVAARRIHAVARTVGAGDVQRDFVLADVDLADAVVAHLLDEGRVRHFRRARARWREAAEHRHQHDGDDDPEKQVLAHVIHQLWRPSWPLHYRNRDRCNVLAICC